MEGVEEMADLGATSYPADKEQLYSLLYKQLAMLMEGERELTPNLANMSALLFQALPDINWAGFYLNTGEELLLAPFQGKPACIRIKIGRGVCGTAARELKTLVVPDVHAFPGHIACDAASRSEIVVPLVFEGRLLGVLDIDSPVVGRFDGRDQAGLEALASLLVSGCTWQNTAKA